jgi:hypothetical protein
MDPYLQSLIRLRDVCRYSCDKMLGGTENQPGRCGEETIYFVPAVNRTRFLGNGDRSLSLCRLNSPSSPLIRNVQKKYCCFSHSCERVDALASDVAGQDLTITGLELCD